MAKKRAKTRGLLEVMVAGKGYWLAEPSYADILDKQERITAMQQTMNADVDALDSRDHLLIALHVATEIMADADGWRDDYPDDDALLGLKPSDVRRIMAAWKGLCFGAEEEEDAAGEDAFRG